jgi:hypothetical protein
VLQDLFGYWAAFAADFKRQGLVTQIGFLLPFIGVPGVGTLLFNRTTKRRLRSALEGSRSENDLLRNELQSLKRKSFSDALEDLSGGDEADLARLERVFTDSSPEVAECFERLARLKISEAYRTGDHSLLPIARRLATAALEIEPHRLVSSLLIDETVIGDGDTDPWLDSGSGQAGLPAGADPEALEAAAVLVLRQVEDCNRLNNHPEAARLARRFLYRLTKDRLLETLAGFYGKLALSKALIHAFDRNEHGISDKPVRITTDLIKTAKRLLPDNHPNYLASLWHHGMALRIADRRQEGLQLLEGGRLLERTRRYLGDRANPTIACRHLYVLLLMETGRSQEALRFLRDLRSDLRAWGKLDDKIASRFQLWEKSLQLSLAQSP